ncbi:MAG: phosphatase PAP2 family protein [Muribaculaceae bacterium]|nr:phosphatase PAP2 family protein [Muribaculaceae bacterium]MDE7081756.1 phosphatase PAP2 family protein [Muribaculaceae bacterium]
MRYQSATLRETLWCVVALALWLTVTVLFIGFRPEHVFLALLIAAMYFVMPASRRLTVAILPFIIFGISYDWMNLLPNYEVNPVDVEGLYLNEKSLFGITVGDGVRLTPNEFWALHRSAVMDFMAGVFYLCWVPLPIVYGLWLYFSGRKEAYLHFAMAFLLVNLLGFALYYVHPAAPPWYVAMYGDIYNMQAVPGTHGEVAGLGAFDAMTGLGIFDALYARNANVFAAMPSLHSAYTFVAFIYAVRSRSPWGWKVLLGVVTLGIWFTAVYTSHHYVLDVLGGIGCSLVAVLLFECGFMRIAAFRRFMKRYIGYIS